MRTADKMMARQENKQPRTALILQTLTRISKVLVLVMVMASQYWRYQE